MSRHVLVDRPDCSVVLGFDRPLQSFFGQRFNPAKAAGIAIDGWPSSIGLGTRRPVASHTHASEDLTQLFEWAQRQQREAVWRVVEAARHLAHVRRAVWSEWENRCDFLERKPPACLTGPLS